MVPHHSVSFKTIFQFFNIIAHELSSRELAYSSKDCRKSSLYWTYSSSYSR